jgi:hypothetical protein
MRIAERAIDLAATFYPVFPCGANKRPACPNGFKDATRDPDGIEALWRQYPAPLIGVPTGQISGFDVLDLDLHKGAATWHAENEARIPFTRTHRTRSGGLHVCFKHRDGIRNSAGKIATGVDVRGDGGYIVWWPATGIREAISYICEPWPAWLVDLAAPVREKAPPSSPNIEPAATSEKYVLKALEHAIRNVACAGEGRRNQTLNDETLALARFIRGGHLTDDEITRGMARAAAEAGLDAVEIGKTIASALGAGKK